MQEAVHEINRLMMYGVLTRAFSGFIEMEQVGPEARSIY